MVLAWSGFCAGGGSSDTVFEDLICMKTWAVLLYWG
jgi:hypothetical protein